MKTIAAIELRVPMARATLGRATLVGAAIANVAAIAILALANAAGTPLIVEVPGRPAQEVSVGPIVLFIMVAAVGAYAVAFVLRARSSRPRRLFVASAIVVLALSFALPASAATGAAVWWLNAMHVAAFAALVTLIVRSLPAEPPRD